MQSHSHHGEDEPTTDVTTKRHTTVGGLAVAANGLRLVTDRTQFTASTGVEWEFRIVDDRGDVVTAFEPAHGQLAHLLVVRRDLTGFQHLHPSLDDEGTWHATEFTLPEAGVYRAFVDVVVDGLATTLGVDLFVPGEMTVADRPGDSLLATTEGYEVELTGGPYVAGEPTTLAFEVSHGGEPVERLDPYLGARGHLVALREGDLAYLHVHPVEATSEGGRIRFGATFPSSGRYRLFLQSKPDGRLVTTMHDVVVGS